MSTSPEDKEKIQNLEARIQALTGRAGNAQALVASSNYWAMSGVTSISNQSGGAGAVALAGIALYPMYTGIFQVNLSVNFSTATTGKAFTMKVVSDTAAAATGLTAGGSGTIATAGFGGAFTSPLNLAAASMQVPTGKVLTNDAMGVAANGLFYNGAPFTTAPLIQKQMLGTSITGLLSGVGAGSLLFQGGGIMLNSITTAKTTFFTNNPIGSLGTNTVAFALIHIGAADTWQFPSLDFSVQEMMLA